MLGANVPLSRAYQIDLDCLPMVMDMERNGILIDPARFRELKTLHLQELSEVDRKVYIWAGREFNVNSSQQKAEVLKKLGVKIPKQTATGLDSTKTEVLELVKHQHPIIPLLLEHSEIAKLISTYDDGIPSKADEDGRIRGSIIYTSVVTGRFAMRKPNLMNIPTRTARGRALRGGFVARPGWVLVSNDLCLARGTLIDTAVGAKPIESMEIGDVVYTTKEGRPACGRVVAVYSRGVQETLKITLDNGAEIIGSLQHRLIRTTGELVELRHLQVGDRLLPLRKVRTPRGAILLYNTSNRKYTYEHRAYIEATQGPIPDKFHVHHLDHDPSNNSLDNLIVISSTEHHSHHAKLLYRLQDHTKRIAALRVAIATKRASVAGENNPRFGYRKGPPLVCLTCEEEFYKPPCYQAKYCSINCFNEARRNGFNHKVASIELSGKQEVWNLTIEPDHNYALACGVMSANSQAEIRMVGIESGDEGLVRGYNEDPDFDVHTDTCMMIFGQVTPELRYIGKTVGFGIVYGLSASGLTVQVIGEFPELGWNDQKSQQVIDMFFSKRPGVYEYIEEAKAFARRYGYVVDMFGRRRNVPHIYSSKKSVRAEAEREGVNFPIQAGATGIIKIGMKRAREAVEGYGLQAQWLLQIHDELLCEAPEEEAVMTALVVNRELEEAGRELGLPVPIRAEAKIGRSWGTMVKLKEWHKGVA